MRLTPTQREGIRAIHDGERVPGASRTVSALRRHGLVAPGTPLGLTPRGEAEYKRIMSSGDGPEALKEMFRF